MNLYAYVGNDPINAIDSSGQSHTSWQSAGNCTVETTTWGGSPAIPDGSGGMKAIGYVSHASSCYNSGGSYGGMSFQDFNYDHPSLAGVGAAASVSPSPANSGGMCRADRLDLINSDDRWYMPANNANNATRPNNIFHAGDFLVVAHGSRDGVYGLDYATMTPDELAGAISGSPLYHGEDVTIAACNVGLNREYLQSLANSLGRCVTAPQGKGWLAPGRPIYSADKRNDFQSIPGGAKKPANTGRDWTTICPSKKK